MDNLPISMMRNIKILYTSNLRGRLDEAPRIGTMVREARNRHAPSVTLSVGNTSWGTDVCNFSKGEPAWMAVRMMGFDGVLPGPEDFLHGWKNLRQLILSLGVPVTLCNLYYTEKDKRAREIPPYLVFSKYPGMKVGVAGVIDEHLELENENTVFLEYADTCAAWAVKQLKKENCNLVVLMAYMSLEKCKTLANTVAGLDLIICADYAQEEASGIIRVNNSLISCENTRGGKLAVVELDII